jgi:hypothetical protein
MKKQNPIITVEITEQEKYFAAKNRRREKRERFWKECQSGARILALIFFAFGIIYCSAHFVVNACVDHFKTIPALQKRVESSTLRAEGYSASALLAAGYSALDVLAAGYSASALLAAGYSASALLAAGYSASELQSQIDQLDKQLNPPGTNAWVGTYTNYNNYWSNGNLYVTNLSAYYYCLSGEILTNINLVTTNQLATTKHWWNYRR